MVYSRPINIAIAKQTEELTYLIYLVVQTGNATRKQ